MNRLYSSLLVMGSFIHYGYGMMRMPFHKTLSVRVDLSYLNEQKDADKVTSVARFVSCTGLIDTLAGKRMYKSSIEQKISHALVRYFATMPRKSADTSWMLDLPAFYDQVCQVLFPSASMYPLDIKALVHIRVEPFGGPVDEEY